MTSLGTDDGFSLIELLVAVAVVSVLAVGVTVPFSRVASGTAFEASRLSSSVSEVRLMAMSSGRPHALRFGSGEWSIEHLKVGGGWTRLSGTELGADIRISFRQADDESTAGYEGPRIVLLPDGRISRARLTISDGTTSVSCVVGNRVHFSCKPG